MLVLVTLLGAPGSASVRAEEDGTIRVDRCVSFFRVELEIGNRSPYQAELCRGGSDPTIYLEAEAGAAKDPPLWGRQQWQAGQLMFSVAESLDGDAHWSGTVDPSKTGWQPMSRVGEGASARIRLSALPIPAGGMVQIRAFHVPSDEILRALLPVQDLKVSVTEPLTARLTLNFLAISATQIVEIIAFENGLVGTWDASGGIALRSRPRDFARSEAIAQAIGNEIQAKANGDPTAIARLQRHYAELHSLIELRDPNDLPPDAAIALSTFAIDLMNDRDFARLVELRRDLLALAQAYDARADSAVVAHARADLAYALQQHAAKGDEDLVLLRAAEPILLQHLDALDAGSVADYASAFSRRGFARSALVMMESGFRPCTADSALSWLFHVERISWDLLKRYREDGSSAQAARVMEQWQECIAGQTTLAQAVRIGNANKMSQEGRFLDSAADYELIFLRLPPLATLETSELAGLLEDALRAHLASGQFARAAEVLSLANRAFKARGGQELEREGQSAREQAFLDALAAAVPQPTSFWNQRYRSQEPLVPDGQASETKLRRFGPSLKYAADAVVRTTLPDSGKPADAIALQESIAVLGFIGTEEVWTRADATRHVITALKLRAQAGASPAQLKARRLELEKLVEVAEQVAGKR